MNHSLGRKATPFQNIPIQVNLRVVEPIRDSLYVRKAERLYALCLASLDKGDNLDAKTAVFELADIGTRQAYKYLWKLACNPEKDKNETVYTVADMAFTELLLSIKNKHGAQKVAKAFVAMRLEELTDAHPLNNLLCITSDLIGFANGAETMRIESSKQNMEGEGLMGKYLAMCKSLRNELKARLSRDALMPENRDMLFAILELNGYLKEVATQILKTEKEFYSSRALKAG